MRIWYKPQVWLYEEVAVKYIFIYISTFCAVGEGRTEAHLHGRDVPEELFNVIIGTAIARRIL